MFDCLNDLIEILKYQLGIGRPKHICREFTPWVTHYTSGEFQYEERVCVWCGKKERKYEEE